MRASSALDAGCQGCESASRGILMATAWTRACATRLKRAGATGARRRRDLTRSNYLHSRYAIPVYYLVATAEASSNLARFRRRALRLRAPECGAAVTHVSRTRRDGFGAKQTRIMLGTYALSAGYYEAFYLKAASSSGD
jgi:aspartyl-tRNA(Asn)/glutamyl-tRNA(Gln) amidotransferase subunit A